MQEYKNPYAEINKKDSCKLITPKEAKNLSVTFYCPDTDCRDTERILLLSTSKLDNLFFRHRSGFEHSYNPVTLLHKLIIQKFITLSNFEIPSFKDERNNSYPPQLLTLDKTKTEIEYSVLKSIKPDVLIETDKGLKIAIEIFVTHEVNEEKRAKIKSLNLPTIEIDLSNFYAENQESCRNDYQFIFENAQSLIEDIKLKLWHVTPTAQQSNGVLRNEGAKTDNTIQWLFGLLVAAILLFFACSRGNSSDEKKINNKKRNKYQ